jgi:putative cell wall-binding protein
VNSWARRVVIAVIIGLVMALLGVVAESTGATNLDRLGGLDRYETAALVADRVRSEGRAGSTVLLTTGENFPDAVAAGGWNGDAVVLLTRRTTIPDATLERLRASWVREVIVVGGPSVVDDIVITRVRGLGKSVTRVWGLDRYATSLAVSSASVDDDSVSSVWVASGASFADQLVAATGARRVNGAFLIVPPSRSLPSSTVTEIQRVATTGATLRVVDSGSVLGSVSVAGLTRVAHTADVFANSAATQTPSGTVVVASGENWPDALGGSRLVTSSRGLVLSRSSCAPTSVADRLSDAGTTIVLGGTVAVSDASARGSACGAVTPPSNPPPLSPLVGLRVEAEHIGGYDRDLFRHWIDADRDGCDARREVLIVESTTPVQVGSGCSITGGTWFSAYDGGTTTDASSFDIDHMIPLKEAWDSGAHAWTADRRQAFANDLDLAESLIAVSASSNRSKSDRDPAEWMPPRTAYHCTYVVSWISVKKAWNLSVDQAEYQKLEQVLATC